MIMWFHPSINVKPILSLFNCSCYLEVRSVNFFWAMLRLANKEVYTQMYYLISASWRHYPSQHPGENSIQSEQNIIPHPLIWLVCHAENFLRLCTNCSVWFRQQRIGQKQAVCALRSPSIMGGIPNLTICGKMARSEHLAVSYHGDEYSLNTL